MSASCSGELSAEHTVYARMARVRSASVHERTQPYQFREHPVQGEAARCGLSCWMLKNLFRGTNMGRAGGCSLCSVCPPALAITSLPVPPAIVFYKYFSLRLSPLLGFAAVKQEDQSQGGGVLVFDPFAKSRCVEHRRTCHVPPIFQARKQVSCQGPLARRSYPIEVDMLEWG